MGVRAIVYVSNLNGMYDLSERFFQAKQKLVIEYFRDFQLYKELNVVSLWRY